LFFQQKVNISFSIDALGAAVSQNYFTTSISIGLLPLLEAFSYEKPLSAFLGFRSQGSGGA
jgi:hypothetical protein